MQELHVFIGYDPREAVAYHVCSNSIIRQASRPVVIHPLALKNLDEYTEKHSVETGLTGYNPTNQFIFSRFLVPYLMGWKGWAVFLDGDMIVRTDIKELFDLADSAKAIQVVKHDYKTKSNKKYLDQTNCDYPRKNWSSVMLFNCSHFAHRTLTPEHVSNATGAYLHRLEWIPDDKIGELPKEWNWLPDEYGANPDAKLIHHTLGTPCFLEEKYSLAPMADEWHREKMLTDFSMQVFVP